MSITNSPNFQAIQLSAEEAKKAAGCIRELSNSNLLFDYKQILEKEMFNIFEPYINKEAKHKAAFNIYEEVFAEMSLKFSELLYDIKNYPTLESFVEKLNEYKPSKDTLKSKYMHKSLDIPVYSDKEILKQVDLLTSYNLPNPKTSEYLQSIKNQINRVLDRANLAPVLKARIKARLNGTAYKDIAQQDGVNIGVAKSSVKKGIMKIQHANGILPENCIKKAEVIAGIFNCDTEKAIKFILKNTATLNAKPETMIRNIKETAKLFNCLEEKIIKMSLKYPDICLQRPETLMNNIKQSAKLLGCTESAFIKSGLNFPQLLYYKPETLLKNAQNASKLFGCPMNVYIGSALIQPQLLCQKPETLKSNIENTAKGLDCSEKELIKAALRVPPIFYLKPETIIRNVMESSKLLNCSEKEFVQAALKCPKIFYLRTETLQRKVKEISRNIGCTEYAFIKMAIEHPYLFCQNPTNIEEKLKAENYYRKLMGKETKNKPAKTSVVFAYSNILAHFLQKAKIEGTENFVKRKQKFNLKNFIKAFENQTFSFKIPEDEAVEDFVKFVQETSIKTIGKNIFEFKITE